MKTFPTGRRALRRSRRWQAVAAVAATLALTAGCAGGAGAGAAAGNGTRQEGGDITFLIDSLGDTWIPNNSAISSFQGHIWGHVTDKLVYVDEEGAVSPWVAESWDQNADATEFTLHLKEGVTFSDGSPLDAEAVVANLDMWARRPARRGHQPDRPLPDHVQERRGGRRDHRRGLLLRADARASSRRWATTGRS